MQDSVVSRGSLEPNEKLRQLNAADLNITLRLALINLYQGQDVFPQLSQVIDLITTSANQPQCSVNCVMMVVIRYNTQHSARGRWPRCHGTHPVPDRVLSTESRMQHGTALTTPNNPEFAGPPNMPLYKATKQTHFSNGSTHFDAVSIKGCQGCLET